MLEPAGGKELEPMFPLLVLALVAAESLTTVPLPALRHVPPFTRLTLHGVVTSDGRSSATARIALERIREPRVDPYAEYLSVGPLGAAGPQAPIRHGKMTLSFEPPHRRLRVTISTYERNVNLTIDEILTGNAGSRSLMAQYQTSPFFDWRMGGLWEALNRAPRVLGRDPTGPAITWFSPTAFAWTTYSDTLLFEQQADSIFQVTVRPRLR
jgi:hypothetical protein